MNDETMPGPPDRFHLKCRQAHYKEAHRRAGTDWIIQTVETYNAFPDLFDEGTSRDVAHMVSEPHARRIVASWNALLDARLDLLEEVGLWAHPAVSALGATARVLIDHIDSFGGTFFPPELNVSIADLRKALLELEATE